MKAFKQILKLFFGSYFALSAVGIWVYIAFSFTNMPISKIQGMLAGSGITLALAIPLLWSYFKNRVNAQTQEHKYYSDFYVTFKKVISVFDGYSFNGFGTKYLLFTNQSSDNTLVATNWLILGFFPIVPLYRNRINIMHETDKFYLPFFSINTRQIKVMNPEPLHTISNAIVYCFYYLIFYPLIFAPVIILLSHLSFFVLKFPGKQFWWLILAYLLWGFFFIFLSEILNKRLLLRIKF